ncbi:proton-coupled folate transporter-like [Diadema antillarum]|uniref:proton-coupled folate transporter-like n=1 Tax=Diadema antillarum TaxID=105358 RepID=UPI003A86EBC7
MTHDIQDGEGEETTSLPRTRTVSVEPSIFLILAVQGVLVNLRTQYVKDRLAEASHYIPPDEGNCSLGNTSEDATGQRIEAETAIWVMYMKSTSVFIPIFTGTILIAASDFVGRKPVLIINAVGHVLASAIFLLVAWLSLPLPVAVAAECILGISGDSIVTINVSFAYVGDSSTGKARTTKYVIVSCVVYFGFGLSQILVDVILQNTGNYVIAFGCGTLCAVLNLVYLAIPGLLMETVQNRTTFRAKETMRALFASFVRLMSVSHQRRNLRIGMIMAIFMLYSLINEAVYAVITIYGLGPPYCWSPTLVGIYNVIVNSFPAAVAVVLIKPLLCCLSGYWILQLGFLSGIGLLITTALARTNNVLVYGAVGVGFLRTVPDAISEDFLSKLVSSQEQGAAFALLSIVTSVGKVISPLLLNAVYAKTTLIGIPQLTFYLAAAIYIVPITITFILQICSHPFERRELQVQYDVARDDEEPMLKE